MAQGEERYHRCQSLGSQGCWGLRSGPIKNGPGMDHLPKTTCLLFMENLVMDDLEKTRMDDLPKTITWGTPKTLYSSTPQRRFCSQLLPLAREMLLVSRFLNLIRLEYICPEQSSSEYRIR